MSKRKRIKPMSDVRKALKARADPERDKYREKFHHCQCCGHRLAGELHEITRGTSARRLAYDKPATWLHLCNPCHVEMGECSVWPEHRQAALKLIVDTENFDLDIINSCRVGLIDAGDVLVEVRKLFLEGQRGG